MQNNQVSDEEVRQKAYSIAASLLEAGARNDNVLVMATEEDMTFEDAQRVVEVVEQIASELRQRIESHRPSKAHRC